MPESGNRPGGARTPSPRAVVATALVVAAAMLFLHLGRLPLIEPDEGRNAEVAREMAERGEWLIPTLNGLTYLDKPAFFFDCVALSLRLFGTSEAAARLPSALFGLAVLGILFAFCRRAYGVRTAAAATIVLATAPVFLVLARAVIFDMALACFVSAAILAAVHAEESEGRRRARWHRAGALAAALATLVKGPVGFLVPALVLVVFFVADGRRAALRRVFSPPNVALFFAVVLPWLLAVVGRHPDFLHYGLVQESWNRFTSPAFRRGGAPYYYVPVLFVALLSWSVLVPESLAAAWRARREWTRADRLFVVWAATTFVFFSLSRTKHFSYVLPAVVALAPLVARAFARGAADPASREARLVLRGASIVALLFGALGVFLVVELRDPGYLGRFLRLDPADSDWLPRVVAGFAFSTIAAATVALVARLRRSVTLAFACHLVLPFSLVVVSVEALSHYAARRSSRDLADHLRALPAATEIVAVRTFPSSLPFYLGRTITVIGDDEDTLRSNYVSHSLRRTGRWPEGLVHSSEAEEWLGTRRTEVALVGREASREFVQEITASRGATFEELGRGYWAVRLPPPGPPADR